MQSTLYFFAIRKGKTNYNISLDKLDLLHAWKTNVDIGFLIHC